MHYDEPYSDQARITLSSVVLLVIFVSAAALIIAAVVWRPWFDDEDAATTGLAPSAEEQAPADGGQPAEGEPAGPVAEAPAAQ